MQLRSMLQPEGVKGNPNRGDLLDAFPGQGPGQFYFKVSAAAKYIGLSANTLRKYTDLGLIRARILPGGDRIYCKEWLDDFIDALPDAVVNFRDTFRPSAYNPSKSDLSSNPRKEVG